MLVTFVATLLAYLTKNVAAAAAIGGLTIAGGAVAVSQAVPDRTPAEEGVTEAALTTDTEEASGTQNEDADGTRGTEGTQDQDAEGTREATGTQEDASGTEETEGAEDEDADGNGRSQAVHDVIFGGEVEPGDPEFGRRVAEAASQGRSEQRGNSGTARSAPEGDDGEAAEREARPAPNDNAAAGQAKAQENRAKAEENRADAQEKREAAKDRRPAPGDAADEDTSGDSAPGAPAARGRG